MFRMAATRPTISYIRTSGKIDPFGFLTSRHGTAPSLHISREVARVKFETSSTRKPEGDGEGFLGYGHSLYAAVHWIA